MAKAKNKSPKAPSQDAGSRKSQPPGAKAKPAKPPRRRRKRAGKRTAGVQRSQGIPAPAYAESRGINRRTVTRLIKRGMPAEKVGGRWHVTDPEAADAWIASNSIRLGNREQGPPLELDLACTSAGPGSGTERHIHRLDQVLGAFLKLLESGHFDARSVTGVRQICAELRQLERHRVAMRQAESELMDRAEHHRTIGTVGRLVAEEIDAFGSSLADVVLGVLAASGIELPADSGDLVRALGAAGEQAARTLRTRIADAIEAAQAV